ncbi:MAG: pantetheine-phosphate adenylyltransferase [Candidatus Yanofskybacteria bacterium]|nr:pantetheine-phosphate adenylyltransferase [Candidatus Yanofskybacteria bacterium]
MRTAVYAGSFDPPTNGHLWVMEQGSKLFDKLVVAVGNNPEKNYLFSEHERIELVLRSLRNLRSPDVLKIHISALENYFLVDFARLINAKWILRGVRSEKDYQYEVDMLDQNKRKAPEIETIFLTPPPELRRVSSSFVKGLVGQHGWENWIKDHLPPAIQDRFIERFKK